MYVSVGQGARLLPSARFAHARDVSEPADIAERLGALLKKSDPEPYALPPESLARVAAILTEARPQPDFDETMRDVFRFAHFLATKLGAHQAGRALLEVALKFKAVDQVFAPAQGARVDDATWRRLLGASEDRRPVGDKKVPGGKKPWEVLGS